MISDLSLYTSRTERDKVIRPTKAGKSAGFVIISITISLAALTLEEPRIVGGRASLRRSILAGATVLWLIKDQTRTLTTNHTPI